MLNREQRDLLVVPYAPPPAPRRHYVGAAILAVAGIVSVLGLAMADYSAAVTAWLVVAGTVAFLGAVGLFVTGVRTRRQFRLEMERAVEPVPVQPAADSPSSIEAV